MNYCSHISNVCHKKVAYDSHDLKKDNNRHNKFYAVKISLQYEYFTGITAPKIEFSLMKNGFMKINSFLRQSNTSF